jgi:flagellar basal-body rod protein FlgB
MSANPMFSSSSIPVLEQVVSFTHARHSVLAGNIANLDTPGYRVRDLSPELFQERLKEAISQRDAEPASLGDPESFSPESLEGVRDSMESILYHDDSNVNLEQQIVEMQKNHNRYNMAMAIMNSQFRLLTSAIREQA